MSDSILYSVAESVATITLNRPEVLNALDAEMIGALRTACEEAADDKAARAVVLRGAGSAFLAGGDIAMFHANLPHAAALVRQGGADLQQAILALQRAPKPVLASVHGAVAGAGISVMAAADLAIAAEGTRFTMAYSKIGASPDGGATYSLPRLVGYRKAIELMLLADVFDAQAALAARLVNWIASPEALPAETERLAQRLARGATTAFGETKRLAQQGYDRPLVAQLEDEIEAFARCAGTADFAEGVAAFMQKREPEFRGE